MNGLRISFWRTVCCMAVLTLAAPAYAVIQSTENFDSNWPSGLFLPGSAFTNLPTTNPVTGWVVNYARLRNQSPQSSPTVLQLQDTATGWLQTPQFTNGIGRLIFFARIPVVDSVSFDVESSTNGADWETCSSRVLSVAGTWVGYTNTFNTTSNLYLRVRKTSVTAGLILYIDSCSVSYLPPSLTVTNAGNTPSAPTSGDGVTVSAQTSASGFLSPPPVLTAFWRDLFSSTWYSLGMTTNAADDYITTNTIPAHSAGAVVEYYVQAAYDNGDGAIVTNIYPPDGASAPLSYTVKERANFTNMMVQGTVNTNMLLVSPYQWQAAVPAASLSNPFFSFRGVSNAAPVTWGDANQSVFALPAHGIAEITPTTITVAGAVSSALSFRFNEQSGAYAIQACAYDNLESWPILPPGVYTNNNWVLSQGSITNDAARALQGAYAVLNGNPDATNSFFQSPYLTNGIGQISFWFRSFVNGGSPTGVIAVQKAASPTSTWTTIVTTNITSTNYLYVTVGQSDRSSHFMRILSNASGNDAGVCLDEIVICDPGAGVTYSNLVNTPSTATLVDTVNVSVNIDAQGGATNLQAWTLYRFGSNGAFNTLSMMNDAGNHFTTTDPIPRSGPGIVQYMVLCSYTGFQSDVSSPVYLPPDTNNPNFYTVLPAQLTVTNASTTPDAPLNGDTVTVSAQVSASGLTNAATLTTFWRDLFSPSWNSLAMTTNPAGAYVTTTAVPAHPAWAVVEYYVRAIYDSGNGVLVTNTYPAAGASAPLSYTVQELSAFTTMVVQGSVNTNMLLVSPYQWQAAVPAASLSNPFFSFRGVSNAAPITWGEANQSVFTLPVYGTAEVTPTTITVAGAVSSALSFRFNEQNGAYAIQSCAYDNLESWPTLPAGVYTNNGWVLSNGEITNDAARALQASYAVLNTNSFFQSPYLTNGIGQISFWFRSFENGGSPTGAIVIQKAASSTSTWSTIAATNTTSTNYLYVSVGQSDRDSHVIRILNNVSTNNAAVCIDEVIICEPGAGVTYSNLLSTPSTATILDTVNIEVNIDARGGATNLQAWTLFRFGTNGIFDTLAMTNDSGNHFVTTDPIPRSGPGTVQYLILCSYTGFQSEANSPVYLPPDTNNPNSYTVLTPSDGRVENFDSNWPSGMFLPGTAFTNLPTTNPVTGWVLDDARLRNQNALSSPTDAQLQDTATGWLQTPLFTNGIGSFIFYYRTPVAGAITFDVESSTNGLEWVTCTSLVLSVANVWVGYTNTFETTNSLSFRIRKTSADAGLILYIDSCTVSYPPSRVAISDVYLNPGYPSTADTVNVSCVITSVSLGFPAVNIAPTLYYRKGGTVAYTAVPMARSVGNQYATTGGIAPFPRDVRVEYYIRCDFNGYYGTAGENQSPAFYPANGSTAPASYTVRAFASSYSFLGATINGASTAGRLLGDRTWQAIALIDTATNQFTITFEGTGYSTGTGYATNDVSWGNSSNWQSVLPLADRAVTNQAAISITGSFQGQYVVRINEQTGDYVIQKCLWQDFDSWDGSSNKYVQAANDSAAPALLTFDAWANNETRVRSDSFAGGTWPSKGTYTNGASGDTNGYVIYGSRIEAVAVQGYAVRTKDSPVAPGQGFVAQASHLGFYPLRGIGTISVKYRPSTDTPATTFGIYVEPTNSAFVDWTSWVNLFSDSGLTNYTTFASKTLTLRTNQTYIVLFSHSAGAQSMYIDDVSVSEWYADTKTVDGWTAAESWIEPSLQAGGGKACRFDVTRADPGALQYIQSPQMTNGVNTISFQYGGISNYPTSFALQISYGDPNSFTTVLQQTNTFSGAGSNYTAVSYVVRSDTNNIYVRLVNTTPSPGVLLVDNLRIGPYALPNLWAINNAAIDASAQQTPPLPRQFYAGACYLNSNRTSDVSTDETTKPFSNLHPYVRSAYLDGGIGEISFWYRNWTISGAAVPPATLVIETAATSSTNESDWTPIAVITNIVNTNDYRYFRTAVYEPDSHYVRIYNNDTISPVGRVCLDEILVTTPMAASLFISNMVPIPQQPTYTDRVDVAVDLYNFFLSPSNLDVRTYFAVATNFDGLASAVPSWRTMTCIATNLAVPGQWYRYKTTTPIPTNAIDTFVRYWVTVRYDGLLSALSTPKTNQTFGVYPSWYDPMNAVYGTNMAYYVVYSCPPGSVWFNEINYLDNGYEYDKQFIELCGKAGVSLEGWKIDIDDAYNGFVAQYVITNFTLNDDTNGHGFWVLGKAAVANIDMELTNVDPFEDPSQSLPSWNGGRLMLRRNWGAAEHKVAYESPADGYEYIGNDYSSQYAGALGLNGSGTNRADFSWVETEGQSPGEQNVGQVLYSYASSQDINLPTITITDFWVNTNVWIVCTRTNGWDPTPWVSTNLVDTNSWTSVPVFSRSQTATNATISFETPADNLPHFYAVEATNAP